MGWWDELLDTINKGKNHKPNTGHMLGDVGNSTIAKPQGTSDANNLIGSLGSFFQGSQPQSNVGMGGAAGGLPEYSLMEQLQQQMQNIQPSYTPYDTLKQQAEGSVGAQYDPQIQQLLRDMASTKTRAGKNESTVKDMYNALSTDFSSQIPQMTADMKASQDAVTSRYKSAKDDLQAQYDQQKTDQQNTLQQLGIQAASQDAQSQAAQDNQYFQNTQNQDQQQTLDALQEQGSAQNDYQSNLASTSKLAGTNASNDIASQLEQYLQSAQGQVSDLKSSKASALSSLIAQLQQSDAMNAQTNYQNQFNNMMAMNNFGLSAQKEQNSNDLALAKLAQSQAESAGGSLFKGTSGMTGLSNYLGDAYQNDPSKASTISNLVSSVLSNPEVESGKHNNSAITNEYLIELIRQAAAKQGVSSGTDINNAIDALLAYKGQLR